MHENLEYQIGDWVCYIANCNTYSDWYSLDTCWKVLYDSHSNYCEEDPKLYVIDGYNVKRGWNKLIYQYLINGRWVSPEYIFTSIEKAREKCNELNENWKG